MRTHAETSDEKSVRRLREERAERNVDLERILGVRRLDEELVRDRLPVRIEVGTRKRDHVWIGPVVHYVLRGHVVDAVQAPAFAAVHVLALVPHIGAEVLPRTKREVAEILGVRVVNEGVVRVLVAGAEDLRRGAGPLKRKLRGVDELSLLSGERGQVCVARGVHRRARLHKSARSVLKRNLYRNKCVALLAHAAHKCAKPYLGTGLPRLGAHPFGLALPVNCAEVVHSLVELRRKPNLEAIAVKPDKSVRHGSAHAREVLGHYRLRACACGRDCGRRATSAGTRHKNIALGDHRKFRRVNRLRDCGSLGALGRLQSKFTPCALLCRGVIDIIAEHKRVC